MSTIDLDTFFAGETAQEAIDAAAWLGTDLDQDPDSIWRPERWGSLLRSLLGRPNNAEALRLEIERVFAEARVQGVVSIDTTTINATVAGVQITLTVED